MNLGSEMLFGSLVSISEVLLKSFAAFLSLFNVKLRRQKLKRAVKLSAGIFQISAFNRGSQRSFNALQFHSVRYSFRRTKKLNEMSSTFEQDLENLVVIEEKASTLL